MPLFEDTERDVVAKVRYVEFSKRESGRDTLFSSPKLQRKAVSGPSGKQYQFRQQGRPTNPESQWLPIRDERDAEHFEQRDGFEVKRP